METREERSRHLDGRVRVGPDLERAIAGQSFEQERPTLCMVSQEADRSGAVPGTQRLRLGGGFFVRPRHLQHGGHLLGGAHGNDQAGHAVHAPAVDGQRPPLT